MPVRSRDWYSSPGAVTNTDARQVWSMAQASQAGLSWEEQHLPWPQGALRSDSALVDAQSAAPVGTSSDCSREVGRLDVFGKCYNFKMWATE